mgnify:FL=1
MQFNQNNLNQANSPYLRQHKNNPIHWQEWSRDVLNYAKQNNKIIFLSIGYSTCHWCHVMANEAFSDKEIADYLNNHFVSIKVDKEQRPDIDKQMMDFLVSNTGSGGWPLNVFLTSNQNPFYSLTYLTPENFLELIKYIKNFYEKNTINKEFQKSRIINPLDIEEDFIIETLKKNFDLKSGGFGLFNKFPLHSTMLFMLHYYEGTKNENIKFMITKTLDAMMEKGLNDHLQGGFFRYCVDSNWNIPHFEKMLYDQAMHLWIYCLSYKIFKENKYKIISEKIIDCLLLTFFKSGFFISAHDADTNHEEGLTYLWSYNELKKILNRKEFNTLYKNYQIFESGNFEGKIHFIKKNQNFSDELIGIEKKLLEIRNQREQPFKDEKFITSWNSLIGIALINAYRYFKKDECLELAKKLFSKIWNEHFYNDKLFHSSFKGKIQEHEFLEDYASFLLFASYLHEETNNYKRYMISLYEKIKKFKEDNWIESENKDFIKVYSDYYDNPIPSSASLAELALIRTEILLGNNYLIKKKFKEPLKNDFFNISIMIKKGLFHIITSENKIDWENLPSNTIQKIGLTFSNCYKDSCSLINNFHK